MDLVNSKNQKLYDSVTVYVEGKPQTLKAADVVELQPGLVTAKNADGGMDLYWGFPTHVRRLASNKNVPDEG